MGLLAGTALAELALRALYYNPAVVARCPSRVRAFFQEVHNWRRRIIQLDPR